MKITVTINDALAARLERESARQGRTTSELVEMALRLLLRGSKPRSALPDLPGFESGGALVDVSSRAALFAAMVEASNRPR